MRIKHWLNRAWHDEHGNMTALSTVTVVVLLTTLLPIVVNWGALFAIRTQSQNSSDAAALAAAEETARRLNRVSQDVWGCVPPETPTTIVQTYRSTTVVPIGNSSSGGGAAQQYTQINEATLVDYNQYVARARADNVHARTVAGVTIPPIYADVRSEALVRGTLFNGLYKFNGTPVRARASAETYLAKVDTWQTPCPTDPKAVAQHYRFRWQVRLIRTNGE